MAYWTFSIPLDDFFIRKVFQAFQGLIASSEMLFNMDTIR